MATMRRVPGPASGQLQQALAKLQGANVRVGWFESSKYPDTNSTPVAYVAAINELGPHKRPFMQPTADERDKEWSALMGQLSKRVIAGKMTVEDALTAVGLQVGGDIQKKIAEISRGGGLSLITLIARAYRRDGKSVTGKTIGEIAALIKSDPSKAQDEATGIADAPLNETGYMRATLSFSVDMNQPVPVDLNGGNS
jgi:hypothetical protein